MKYYIPFIGLWVIWNDIPHFEHERSFKPLQGDDAFKTMLISFLITAISILTLVIFCS